MWNGLLPLNVIYFPRLLYSASAVIDEKQSDLGLTDLERVILEIDSGLNLFSHYVEAHLGAKNFPASGNYLLWNGINLYLQISTLLS